jgi:general secretion pathway protein D
VNPFQTIQREDVGTSLKIIPQINEGSGVKLEIEQETSSLSSTVQGAADLVTNKRTITTSVFVNDGEVLVLGGLIDDQLFESERRVPGLSRIPGLGWLFRARKTDRKKTNLMVFIRPTILHNAEDARFQTNAKYRYIQDLQREMAENRVRLLRSEDRPELPPLPEGPPEPAPSDALAPDGSQPR